MQHHFLPKGAYLRFFEAPEKPGFVYFYQRQKDIVQTSINNVAKERHLYSFTDKQGNKNTTLESKLGEFEHSATPVLDKLAHATDSVEISVDEFNHLMSFVSLQVVRTPAFRKMMEQIYAQMAKMMMQARALIKDEVKLMLEKANA